MKRWYWVVTLALGLVQESHTIKAGVAIQAQACCSLESERRWTHNAFSVCCIHSNGCESNTAHIPGHNSCIVLQYVQIMAPLAGGAALAHPSLQRSRTLLGSLPSCVQYPSTTRPTSTSL